SPRFNPYSSQSPDRRHHQAQVLPRQMQPQQHYSQPPPPQQQQQQQQSSPVFLREQQHRQAPSPLLPPASAQQQSSNSAYSSQVILETGCHIYRYNSSGDTVEQSLHQIMGSNGKVYIEYIPGHSLIYIPSSVSPSLVMSHTMSNARQSKLKQKQPQQQQPVKAMRPSNVFFKYRSYKLPELQMQHPKLNQTIISRMVAEHWKTESEEVKNRFKKQYKEEMVKYEVAKKLSRYQSAAIASSSMLNYIDEEEEDMSVATYSHMPSP
ncbi:hypothetical protein GGI21_002389, partial [Coemansia aciculifera]